MEESKPISTSKEPLITGGIELLGQSLNIFSKKWKKLIWVLFLIPLIVAAISFVVALAFTLLFSSIFVIQIDLAWKITVGVILGLLGLAAILFAIYISMISNISAVSIVDSDIGVKEAMRKSMPLFWKYLGFMFLFGIIITIGFILFFVPGVVVGVMLSMSMYLLILDGTGPIESMKKSRQLVRGFWWTVLARFMVVGVFAVLVSLVGSMINNMGMSLLEFGGENPAFLAIGIVVAVITFVFSVAVNFVINSISLIYGYLICGQLKEKKNLDASIHDDMSVGKKVGLGFLLAVPIILFVMLVSIGIMAFALGAMEGIDMEGTTTTTPTSIMQDLQPQPVAPEVK